MTIGILSSLSEGIGLSLFIPFLQSLVDSNDSGIGENVLGGFLDRLFDIVPQSNRLVVIPLLIFGSILLKNALTYSNLVLLAWLNSRISHRLRSQIFNQLLKVSYSFLETKD